MTRRQLIAAVAAAPLAGNRALWAEPTPTSPVAIERCRSYDNVLESMTALFDQLGGLGRVVKNKTVTVKLNLTGSPRFRLEGKPLGLTHYTHPQTAGALAYLLERNGAKRIRFVESCSSPGGSMEEYLISADWDVRLLFGAAKTVEFENTNNLGKSKQYVRMKVPGGGHIFPAFDLNRAYEDTDVFMSMAKLKNHAICGVTLSMKNCFGITPSSVYGGDAGVDEPNEQPRKGRVEVCHKGLRAPSRSAPQEIDPTSSRFPGYRMPRIVADLAAMRPIDIALIDGIETMAGGEGPWIGNCRHVAPGLLIAGFNAVTTDTVATAAMGYNPRADRGSEPFLKCDNSLKLAEAHGIGTTDLNRIEVRGLKLQEAVFPFGRPNLDPSVA